MKFAWLIFILISLCFAIAIKRRIEYNKTYDLVMNELDFIKLNKINEYDDSVIVKSRQAVEKYDEIKYFKESGN